MNKEKITFLNKNNTSSSGEIKCWKDVVVSIFKPSVIIALITAVMGPYIVNSITSKIEDKKLESNEKMHIMLMQKTILKELINISNDSNLSSVENHDKIAFISTLISDNNHVFNLEFPTAQSADLRKKKEEKSEKEEQLKTSREKVSLMMTEKNNLENEYNKKKFEFDNKTNEYSENIIKNKEARKKIKKHLKKLEDELSGISNKLDNKQSLLDKKENEYNNAKNELQLIKKELYTNTEKSNNLIINLNNNLIEKNNNITKIKNQLQKTTTDLFEQIQLTKAAQNELEELENKYKIKEQEANSFINIQKLNDKRIKELSEHIASLELNSTT